jgi:hypothetical protein
MYISIFKLKTSKMKNFIKASFICLSLMKIHNAAAQKINLNSNLLEPVQVSMSEEKLMGQKVIRVVKDPKVVAVDQPTFTKIRNLQFSNGTIEVKVLSRLLKDAPDTARGFIGLAFRINDNNSKFESIYIRPTNGRAENQIRRNHSVQYFSYPNFPFQRLRKESPETYETHVDIGLNEWTTLRITIEGDHARLYINNEKYPTLIVDDLKLGPDANGAIGLWVDVGTEGFFKDLRVTPKK